MKKKISLSILQPFIESRMVKRLEPGQGYKFMDGVFTTNNSDATVYVVFLSEFDVESDE